MSVASSQPSIIVRVDTLVHWLLCLTQSSPANTTTGSPVTNFVVLGLRYFYKYLRGRIVDMNRLKNGTVVCDGDFTFIVMDCKILSIPFGPVDLTKSAIASAPTRTPCGRFPRCRLARSGSIASPCFSAYTIYLYVCLSGKSCLVIVALP